MQRTTPLLWMHRIPAQRPKALIREPPSFRPSSRRGLGIAGLEAYGRREGCAAMRIYGRRGWRKLLPEYRTTRVLLEKPLTPRSVRSRESGNPGSRTAAPGFPLTRE